MISEAELKEMEAENALEEARCGYPHHQFPKLIAEVRRLRAALARLEESDVDCHNVRCDGYEGQVNYGDQHRCFKDGRWLDDGSEM